MCSERALALHIVGISLGCWQDMYSVHGTVSRQCCGKGAGCYDYLVRC